MQTTHGSQFSRTLTLMFALFLLTLAGAVETASAQTPTHVYTFTGGTGDVANTEPYGVMNQGRDGNLYSAAPAGGANAAGGIFLATPAGTDSVIYNFKFTDGSVCQPGFNMANDGNFYGHCFSGGPSGQGVVYKVTPSGTFTILHAFTGGADGGTPNGPPIQAADGNLYATTWFGGAHNLGTVYKLTLGGTFTTLYSFTGAADGSAPSAPFVQGTDGNLYGSSQYGGAHNCGTIFKITTAGKLTVVHAFTCTDGNRPVSAMIQGADGNFYGTTYQGGANDNGVVFKMTAGGSLTVLHSMLAATDGGNPEVALLQATDGNFYGVNFLGGNAGGCMNRGQGSIFKVTAKGVFSILYLFDGTVGSNPGGALVQNTNGLLYGDTYMGAGAESNGIFYSLNIGAKPFLRLSATSGIVGNQVGILGEGFSASSVVEFNGVTAAFTLTAPGFITATVPAGATTGFVTVTTGSTTLTSLQKFLVHDSWSGGAAMPVALEFPAAGLASGKIYVAGGLTTTAIANNQVYNPATNTWGTAAPLPVPTYGGGSAVVANVLYVFGGYLSGGTPTNAVWAYKPSTNTWTAKAAMPTARGSSVAVVKGTIIYVMGGNGSTNRLNTVESYNTATNTWTTQANLLVGKSEPSAGLLGTTIVVADGYTASGDTGDNEGYNTSTNAWSALAVDPILRNAACSGSVGGQLYVAGGWTNNPPPMNLASSFSLTTHKWTTQAALPHAVGVPGSAVSGGLLYCFGGTDGTNVQNFVQIYQP